MAETKKNKVQLYTYTGHKLSQREALFIEKYLELGVGQQAVKAAGYSTKNANQYAQSLLSKSYIAEEIKKRLEDRKKQSIADADEIMEYFTKVMRGEEKDQFGLDAPLGERTKAAQELAKRTIDIEQRLAGKTGTTEVKITLDWGENPSNTEE